MHVSKQYGLFSCINFVVMLLSYIFAGNSMRSEIDLCSYEMTC